MSRSAWIYICSVFLAAAVFVGLAVLTSPIPSGMWLPFAGLTLLATLSQLFQVEVPGRQAYYPHTAFFFAGVLLLPPPLFVLLVAVPHLMEWAKERILKGPHLRSWYIQPFNIAGHIVAGSAAYWLFRSFGSPVSEHTPLSMLAVTLAAGAYILINHVLVGLALVMARGLSLKGSGVFALDSLLPDFIMCYVGYIVAVLVELSPWLALPALSPLVLAHRVFVQLHLKQNNLTDHKTGLWNIPHFNSVFAAELERATRFNRYLSIMVADLDLPQEINNTYGRVALNMVLANVGKVFKQSIRQYDVAAYFNGERFALLLPETNPFESLVVAERLRSSVEAATFQVETSSTPIQVTVSVGIACFPGDGVLANELLNAATDAAQYARSKGSNRTVCFADMPPITSPLTDTGNLKLTGEVYAPTEKNVGFASPAFRNSQSR